MDVRSFKNSDIDRLNEEQMTTECARCGHRGLTEGEVCIREWEGDSDAPMCAPCWDETEEEENALEEGGEEGLEILLNERKNLFGCSSTADMVSAELVEDEEAKEVYGVCDCCGMEGKFFGEEGDDWTCPPCAEGRCSCDHSDEELLVCSYCGKDENECEKNKQGEKNPITDWCGGWGISCDDCYYRWNADTEDEEDEEEGKCEDCGAKDTDECRPDCPYQIKAQIKHLLADLETAEGRGGVQRFITEELRYLF